VLAVAQVLEGGSWRGRAGPLLRAMSSLWERASGASLVRRLEWPAHVRVVAVGGATLGGSGKTPLAMACAAYLAGAGARTVLVGHAYRARPGHARVVCPDDRVADVGDEALLAARELRGTGARVVVAPGRAEAVALAARIANVVVLDGVAQTAPVRASLALLAVDALEPWGAARAAPPCGDLKAAPRALLAACDLVVPLGDGPCADPGATRVLSRGAWVDEGKLLTWRALRETRLGLFVAMARPERVLRSLAARGLTPRAVVRVRDHGPLGVRAARALAQASREVDLWVASPKCALHLWGARVATLDHRVVLPAALCSRLARLAVP